MASLIPGFEYDIFISYRQKDNKHDGWVTEFVDNLKGELESTFKEEISVYFDINPHDGLLETHDVDASLKDKLKCLVFIPIISRTYCDPKSFAWEHEFNAFIDQALQDQFGLKVKLPNGNVTNRVLPVRIYDLDNTDIKLCESVLGGVLRSVDFIYKSAGVNRPLRSKEEKPQDNLNNTLYRDQINKVANSIKEIITAMGQYSPEHEEVQKKVSKPISAPRKNRKTTIIAGSVIGLALIILGFLFIPKLFKPSEQLEKSIAVLPFKLLSDEPDKQYLADGMMDAITLHLSKIKDLRVMSRTSVEQYRVTTKTTRQIGKELDVDYILEGSFQKYGDDAKLIVQLIKAGEESHAWGNEYNIKWSEVFSLQSEVAQAIAKELDAVITPEEKQLIEKTPTTNLTAYDFYQRGQEEYSKYLLDFTNWKALGKAEDLYHTALKYDSTFALAYTGLAVVYVYKHYAEEYYSTNFLDSCLILIDRALSFDDHLAEAYFYKANCYWELGRIESVLKELDNALKYNPNYWEVYEFKGTYLYAWNYHDLDYIKAIENLQKAISLNHGKELPRLLRTLGGLFEAYAGFFEQANIFIQEAFKLDNDSALYFSTLAGVEQDKSNYKEAIEYYKKSLAIDSTNMFATFNLAYAYAFSGKYKESLKYYVKCVEWIKVTKYIAAGGYHRIGYSYWMNGNRKEAEYWFNEQKKYCEESVKNNRMYAIIGLATYYDLAGVNAFLGDKGKAYENLKIFSKISVCPFWWLTLIKDDPLFNSIRNEPEFQKIVNDLEAKYQAEHERVRKWLEEQGQF